MTDEPISLGSASHIALSPWRSTKNDPPPKTIEPIHARRWNGKRWVLQLVSGHYVNFWPNIYLNWMPFPDPNDGTTDKDWQ